MNYFIKNNSRLSHFIQSSLIQAILRELPLCEGRIYVRGVVSYAPQEPWIFSGTIQQNILFGSPMDKERFKKVIIDITLYLKFKPKIVIIFK